MVVRKQGQSLGLPDRLGILVWTGLAEEFPWRPGAEDTGAAQVSLSLTTPAGLQDLSQTNLGMSANWIHYKPLDKIPDDFVCM
jgi:hypothetical protein